MRDVTRQPCAMPVCFFCPAGAVVYYDGMHNDTRMNLLIALTACQHGAAVANYVEVRHGHGSIHTYPHRAGSLSSERGSWCRRTAAAAAAASRPERKRRKPAFVARIQRTSVCVRQWF